MVTTIFNARPWRLEHSHGPLGRLCIPFIMLDWHEDYFIPLETIFVTGRTPHHRWTRRSENMESQKSWPFPARTQKARLCSTSLRCAVPCTGYLICWSEKHGAALKPPLTHTSIIRSCCCGSFPFCIYLFVGHGGRASCRGLFWLMDRRLELAPT
jgi:hypothetical protein